MASDGVRKVCWGQIVKHRQIVSINARVNAKTEDFTDSRGQVLFGDGPVANAGYSVIKQKEKWGLAGRTAGLIAQVPIGGGKPHPDGANTTVAGALRS